MNKSGTYTVSQERLRNIIKQELEAVLSELPNGGLDPFRKGANSSSTTGQLLQDVNPYHKGSGPGGGQFTTKQRGKIYSVTGNARDNVKNIPVGRGTNKGGKPVAKFGVNSGSPDKQCGKMTIDGAKKRKTRRCQQYPKSYWDKVDEDLDIQTGLPVSSSQAKKNKSRQLRRDKLGFPKELDSLSRGVYQEGSETWIRASTLRRLFEGSQGRTGAPTSVSREQLASKCRQAGFRSFDELLKAMDAMKRASDGKLLDAKG